MPGGKFGVVVEGIGGAARIAFTVLFSPLLRPYYSRWGTTAEEAERRFPGDEWVPHPRSQVTGAISVHAPAACVWPWFVQLGCGRGGWYSYDLLDNGGVPSADRIIPEYQHLAVGDMVAAVPGGGFGFPVAAITPQRALVLAGTLNTATGKGIEPDEALPAAYFAGDQTFVVEPVDDGSSRLLFRMRTGWNPTFLNNMIYRGIVEPVSAVMGRKLLLTVKRRAEDMAAQGAG